MKFDMRNQTPTRRGGTRKPLRTVAELADEFGIYSGLLGKLLASDPEAPKCKSDNSRCGVALRAKWFDPIEVRKWWQARKASEAIKG